MSNFSFNNPHMPTYKHDNYPRVCLYSSPFANCQTFSIASFHSIPKKEVRDTIHECMAITNRKQCMIDIQEDTYEKVKDLFLDEELVINTPYLSSNNHPMRLLLIKLVNK